MAELSPGTPNFPFLPPDRRENDFVTDNKDNNTGAFYNPQTLPYPVRRDYQEFVNRTNGLLSITILDSIHNLLTLVPSLHSENLQLAGEDVVWLRRMHWGVRCPYFDEVSDQNTVSKCTLCYDTTYLGGYFEPVLLKMSFIPGRADILIEEAGLTVSQKPRAWTQTTIPTMEEQDIIVTFENERYEINSSEQVEKQGRVVYQDLTLSRIDKSDVKYLIPVPGRNGDDSAKFTATIEIRGPRKDFAAEIFIVNDFFYGSDGVVDNLNWNAGN